MSPKHLFCSRNPVSAKNWPSGQKLALFSVLDSFEVNIYAFCSLFAPVVRQILALHLCLFNHYHISQTLFSRAANVLSLFEKASRSEQSIARRIKSLQFWQLSWLEKEHDNFCRYFCELSVKF